MIIYSEYRVLVLLQVWKAQKIIKHVNIVFSWETDSFVYLVSTRLLWEDLITVEVNFAVTFSDWLEKQ